MPKRKKIHHPEANEIVSRSFVAFGTAPRRTHEGESGKITATLLDMNDQPTGINGQSLQDRPNWAFFFGPVEDGDYKLKITWHDGQPERPVPFRVRGHLFIGINYPQQNGSVCNSFVAYGTQNLPNPAQVSGDVEQNGNRIDGTTIMQPTALNNTFAIQFANVPGVDNFTLEASDTAGGFASRPIVVTNCDA